MNSYKSAEIKEVTNEPITDTINSETQMELLPEEPKRSGRGGARPGAGRPPSGRSESIKYNFYQLLNYSNEAKDLVDAWDKMKQIAMAKALQGDTEDLRWYLNRFIPQAREGGEINIDTTGNQPIITIVYDGKE
jgi:hypothetical protein